MIETVKAGSYFCNTCSHDWSVHTRATNLHIEALSVKSVDDLVTRTGIRREELQTLATSAPSRHSATSVARLVAN